MNRTKIMLAAISLFFALTASAQGDYIVKTNTQKSAVGSEEELFTVNNFPYYAICDWKAGQKFMLVVEDKYGFMPVLKSVTNDRDVNNNKIQHKILEFQGTEEMNKETYSASSLSTRFMFEAEGEKYYHEVKNQSLGEICASNQRALIYNLVFLGDVDIARELLEGKTLFTKVTTARVDDGNATGGSREVTIQRNMEVTVTGIGAGTRECPVKIVFKDKEGNSYFRNVMFSKTNSGLLDTDMVGANLEKYFPNVFSFTDKEMKSNEDIRTKYIGRSVYPKRTFNAKTDGGATQTVLRYTPLIVKNMILAPSSTMATLKLADRSGTNYTVDVDLKYDIFIRNENYIDDMFGNGDIRKQYPAITEENWLLVGRGEVKTGMTRDECELAMGSPIQIVVNSRSRYETWYYQGKTIEFEGNKISRIL